MAVLIVADSGPIISLARIHQLQLIPGIFQNIVLPSTVYEEIVIKGKGKPGELEIKDASWINVQKPENQVEVRELRKQFDAGESEAIILAEELKATLLADEWIVLKEARNRGLNVFSTQLILVEAKKMGLIKSVKEEIDKLLQESLQVNGVVI